MNRSRVLRLGFAAACLFLAGCYERVQNGDETIYHFAWWTGIMVIVGGIAGFCLGLALRRIRMAWVLIIACPILLVIVAPAMFFDRVTIDQNHFTARYGFWFAPHVKDVRFGDVQSVQIVEKRDAENRASYEMQFRMKSGAVEVLPLGTLVQNARDEIVSVARSHNIPVDMGPLRR